MHEIVPFVENLHWLHPVAIGVYVYVALMLVCVVVLALIKKQFQRINRKLLRQKQHLYKQIAKQIRMYENTKGYLTLAAQVGSALGQIIQGLLWSYAESKLFKLVKSPLAPRPLWWRILSFGMARSFWGRFR